MRILNFGSLNIDYVYQVDHFVQQGETLSSSDMKIFSGGKGLNQSVAVGKAGADITHAGMIGKDGMFLLDVLKDAHVNVDLIRIGDQPSGHAIIQNDVHGDNCILLYGGANQCITKSYIDEVLSHFEQGDILIVQNEINELDYLIHQAKALGMMICLNPSPMNEKILQLDLNQIDLFILNEVEAAQILGQEGTIEEIIFGLKQRFNHAKVVCTLGALGAVYFDNQQEIWQKAAKVKAVDTTAAGDTFTGYFIFGMFKQLTMKEAMRFATAASAITVTRQGAAPSIPTVEEVKANLISIE